MRTASAAFGTAAFAATVPATVAGAVPFWLARGEQGASPTVVDRTAERLVGALSVSLGLVLVTDAFIRFVRARGTPAPVAETADLVTTGPYRYTRNPQYVGVVALVAGQGLLWGSRRVLTYAAALGASFDTWVRVYEEPRLQRRFGAEYTRYVRRVPRWIAVPRRSRRVT